MSGSTARIHVSSRNRSWGIEDQNCGNPEPRKYDKATVIGLKETEEDG
jgi:hypothetical protein